MIRIFGNGRDADWFLFEHRGLFEDVECFITSNQRGVFRGKELKTLDDVNKDNAQIIVSASKIDTYNEIADMLDSKGYREYEDYIWTHMFEKKIVIVNANCHGSALIKYLNLSPTFRKEYFVYPVQEIQDNVTGEIPERILKKADVFIHQDIREANKISYKLSDNYTLKIINKNCVEICIPNFVGMAHYMFPNQGKLLTRSGTDFYEDIVLDKAVANVDHNLADVQKYWDEYVFDDATLDGAFEKDMEKIRIRQKNWDVPVYDYIANNYKKIAFFVDVGHPSSYLMKSIGKYVADAIGITDISDDTYSAGLGGTSSPIMNCVSNHFGFDFEYPVERKCFWKGDMKDYEQEYIVNYCWWHHSIIL